MKTKQHIKTLGKQQLIIWSSVGRPILVNHMEVSLVIGAPPKSSKSLDHFSIETYWNIFKHIETHGDDWGSPIFGNISGTMCNGSEPGHNVRGNEATRPSDANYHGLRHGGRCVAKSQSRPNKKLCTSKRIECKLPTQQHFHNSKCFNMF